MESDYKINRIRIPIPIPALKHINTYLISKDDKHYLIDTGTPVPETLNSLIKGLKKINVPPSEISGIIITHMHIDHIGNAGYLQEYSGAPVYMNKHEYRFVEYFVLNFDESSEDMKRLFSKHGVPQEKIENILKKHPALSRRNAYKMIEKVVFVEDNQKLNLNGVKLKVIETPGHSPHHTCYYDEGNGILFAGDHILSDITPNVMVPMFNDDPLGDYLNSLEKIGKIQASIYYPAHREPNIPIRERIKQLKKHHYERLLETARILTDSPKTAYKTASKLTWDINIPWEKFPAAQLFFAVGEALAHIRYLQKRELVKKIEKSGKVYYKNTKSLDEIKNKLEEIILQKIKRN